MMSPVKRKNPWQTEDEYEIATTMSVEQYLKEGLPDGVPPWEKIPHESPKAFRAFEAYRDAGARRSYNYVRGLGISIANNWPTDYNWQMRVRWFDEFTYAQDAIEERERRKELGERHAKEAANALEAIMAPIRELQRRIEKNPDEIAAELAEMPASKLVSQVQASARVLQPVMSAERLASDMPTEVVESSVQAQVNIQDNPEKLIDVLGTLAESGVLDALRAANPAIEVIDAKVEPVGEDGSSPEAMGLPPSSPA
jgi:hypothetical protein